MKFDFDMPEEEKSNSEVNSGEKFAIKPVEMQPLSPDIVSKLESG
jgi:hypothetical protein